MDQADGPAPANVEKVTDPESKFICPCYICGDPVGPHEPHEVHEIHGGWVSAWVHTQCSPRTDDR
jgi:hypothetical protein